MSNGILKVQNASILVDFIEYYDNTLLNTQTHTQACRGGGGGGGGRGGGGSGGGRGGGDGGSAPRLTRPPAAPPPPHACVCVYVCRGVSGFVFGLIS